MNVNVWVQERKGCLVAVVGHDFVGGGNFVAVGFGFGVVFWCVRVRGIDIRFPFWVLLTSNQEQRPLVGN